MGKPPEPRRLQPACPPAFERKYERSGENDGATGAPACPRRRARVSASRSRGGSAHEVAEDVDRAEKAVEDPFAHAPFGAEEVLRDLRSEISRQQTGIALVARSVQREKIGFRPPPAAHVK